MIEQDAAAADFEAALDYLYSFINFEQRPQDRYMSAKLDASRPQRFMRALGAPHQAYPAIHIAGTKGKGSVASMAASSLCAAGYKVGLYTSPHLQEFRERIRVLTLDDEDGRISKAGFVQLMAEVRPVIVEDVPDVTWFEILTAVAFLHFARERVDVAVIEVGLGGRLDATNVIMPLVSVITSLSMDHTKFLGNTLSDIAYEKAGILKEGVPVVIPAQKPEALATLLRLAQERAVPVCLIGDQWQYQKVEQAPAGLRQSFQITRSPDPDFIAASAVLQLPLLGDYQLENALAAIAALQIIRERFPRLDTEAVRQGLLNVSWRGRLQVLHRQAGEPLFIADCAHNPDSAAKLSRALSASFDYEQLWLIYGSARDKDIEGIFAQLLPAASGVITTTVNHPRSATPAELTELAQPYDLLTFPALDMETAVTLSFQQAGPADLICVTGSIYVVGDLLNQWDRLQSNLVTQQQLFISSGS